MKVTLIIWISAIILQEVEPGTIVRIPRDVANLKSSIHTEYEANYKQKGKHGNDSFSTIKGNQEILHENCNDTWNEFAEKCASLVKDLIASLANTISSSPGDATNLQLHIKNNFTHVDKSHKRTCFKNPPSCLSNLNFSSLFNNDTGNILNKPNAEAPLSVLTTLKKPNSCEEGTPIPVQPNDEDVILNNSSEDPKTSQQGSSLGYINGSPVTMNPEEAEGLASPQINNDSGQVKYPTPELEGSGNTAVSSEDSSEDSTTNPSTSSGLTVIPLNTEAFSNNGEVRVLFDPKDRSVEISAVPSNAPFNIRNTSPNPYSVDRMGNSDNSILDQNISNENKSSGGPKPLGVATQSDTSSESSNEFLSNLADRKNSLAPKYTSQQVSSEEEKYHTYLPPQSLVGEPLLGDSQLNEEIESEEEPNTKTRRHGHHEENDHILEKMPHPPTHDHHPPLPKIMNEPPPVPVIPHHPFITPATPSPPHLDSALPSMLPSEDSQSKQPSHPLLSTDHTPDLSKTNESPHSISHQDPLPELKHETSNLPHPIENQPIITDDSPPPILVPVSEPKTTQPEILPALISNVEPPAKEVSHDDHSNGNQPPSPLESVPSPESTQPQILSFPQSSNKPLEASNHLSNHATEPAVSVEELVSSEEKTNYESPGKESSDDKSLPPPLLLIPAPETKESISHVNKPSSSEQLEIVPPHDPHEAHQHSHPHLHHPHPHPSTIAVGEDEKKSSPEIKHIPVVELEEKPSSPTTELIHPHPHPKIELVPVSPPEKDLPPSPPPKVELVPVPPPEHKLPPPPPPPPTKVELVPVHPPEKELPPHHHPPPPPPPKVELVAVPPPEDKLPPPPPPKVELVPVPPPEKELPPHHHPPPPPPPKVELVPVHPPEDKLLPPPPPPPTKIELVPVPPPEKELPPPSPPPKVELVIVPPPEDKLPPPPPPKIELVPVSPPEDKLPPPPPPPEKELPPPPPPPPPKVELVPVPPSEKELPPHHHPPPPPPPKVELVAVPPPEDKLPPPPKVELVPVLPPEKELPPHHHPPPPPPPEDKLPPPPPPKVELVPVHPPEDKLPPPPPPKIELVPVPPPEKELPPPPPPPPPKVELVPLPPPEHKLPPPPPEKELPPPPPPPPPKIKLVPISSSEQNEIPSHELKDDKAFADMPWPPHAPHPAHHHHPHHPPPHQPHHHHHHPHKKEEDGDDDSSLYSLEDEKQLEREKATTFQTTSADPTPPENSLSYPPFFMPNPTSQAPPPLTIPSSEPYPMIPSSTTFKTVPANKQGDNEEDDEEDEEEDCCSCESCTANDGTGGKIQRMSACQDLEQARRELKAIFDKIKKKLKCGRKTQRPTITT